jgi:HK97 family phage major capsid protein
VDEKLQALRDQLAGLQAEGEAVRNAVDDEGREFTADELEKVEALGVQADALKRQIDAREKLARQSDDISRGRGRRTDPTPVGANAGRVPAELKDGKCGFNSFGDFALSVCKVGRPGGMLHMERRLEALAPSSYANSSSGSDGGFAVPQTFLQTIVDKVVGPDTLLGRTMQMSTAGNGIKFPVNEDEPWGTAGVTAAWTGEGQRIAESKPNIRAVSIDLHKIAALTPLSDELAKDAPALETFLGAAVPAALNFKVDEALLFGTGVGQPQGATVSGSKVRVAQSGSPQAADTINYANVATMWARMYGPCRKNAVWLVNQDAEPELSKLVIATGTASGQLVYMPPGGVSGAGYGTLFGRPVLPSEHCAQLGDEGDIILWDPTTYVSLTPTGQSGARFESSIHLWFDYAVSALRWTFRIGGKSWWSKPVTRAKSANTLSNCLTLEERAGS